MHANKKKQYYIKETHDCIYGCRAGNRSRESLRCIVIMNVYLYFSVNVMIVKCERCSLLFCVLIVVSVSVTAK